jgi:hypothetical protein
MSDPNIEEIVDSFEKKYPINYGNPYPHFVDGTPVATHIIQELRSSLKQIQERTAEICLEIVGSSVEAYHHEDENKERTALHGTYEMIKQKFNI